MLFSIVEATKCEEEVEKRDKDEASQAEERKLDAGRRFIGTSTAGNSFFGSHGTDVGSDTAEGSLQRRKSRRLSG